MCNNAFYVPPVLVYVMLYIMSACNTSVISFYLMRNMSTFNIIPIPCAYCPYLTVQYLFYIHNVDNYISSLTVLSHREGYKKKTLMNKDTMNVASNDEEGMGSSSFFSYQNFPTTRSFCHTSTQTHPNPHRLHRYCFALAVRHKARNRGDG